MGESKNIYQCPVCQLKLKEEEKYYLCSNNHSFDKSRKGYINLLLVNQKATKEPGDSKEMVLSRKEFLNKGYYKPLAKELSLLLTRLIQANKDKIINVLDAGCGEGYFTCYLKKQLVETNPTKNLKFWGIDISKPAINYAATRDRQINFAVASNYNLPILSNSVDYVLWTFAPGDEGEFHRVLKDNGKLIMVIPGVRHLFGLKELVYDQARQHEPKEKLLQGFKLLDSQQLTYSICLENPQDIMNLLAMTPYYWHISSEGRKRAEQARQLQTDVDFLILVYEKLSSNQKA